jgi:hypothetical protein
MTSQPLNDGLADLRPHGILDDVIGQTQLRELASGTSETCRELASATSEQFFYYGTGSPAAVGRA